MSLLSILKFPDPFLRKKSTSVEKVSESIIKLADNMFETMYAEDGIGLAAPQVGEGLRLIVLDVPKVDAIDPEKVEKDPLAMVNPKVVSGEGTIQFEEGCLSCPELIVLVDRMAQVHVKYLNLEGKPCEIDVSGLKGVCIQHEIDHLNGILLVDKLSRLKRDLYKNQQLKIAKEEIDLATVL